MQIKTFNLQFPVAAAALAALFAGRLAHSPLHHLGHLHSESVCSHDQPHAVKTSCCGHSHSHSHRHDVPEESKDHEAPSPHEDDGHCHLCDLISAPVTVAIPVSVEWADLGVTFLAPLLEDCFESRFSAPAIARGPPVEV